MTRHEVHSSFVRAVDYDPDTREATVHLNAGSYRAHDVPDADVKALIGASSVGTHFNTIFKKKHGHKLART